MFKQIQELRFTVLSSLKYFLNLKNIFLEQSCITKSSKTVMQRLCKFASRVSYAMRAPGSSTSYQKERRTIKVTESENKETVAKRARFPPETSECTGEPGELNKRAKRAGFGVNSS